VLAWWEEECAEEEDDIAKGIKLPKARRDFRFRMRETAKEWNVPWDQFLRISLQRQAEMIAHEIIRSRCEAYDYAQREKEGEIKKARKAQRVAGSSAVNPAWMLAK
jgi:hypothetical protein